MKKTPSKIILIPTGSAGPLIDIDLVRDSVLQKSADDTIPTFSKLFKDTVSVGKQWSHLVSSRNNIISYKMTSLRTSAVSSTPTYLIYFT